MREARKAAPGIASLAVIATLALGARLAAFAFLSRRGSMLMPDAIDFREAGVDLFTSGRIQSDIVMPLYPAWTYITGGGIGLQIADIILSALTAAVVCALSYEMFNSRRAAFVAAAGACSYPFFLYYAPAGVTETFFIFLLCSAFLALYRGSYVVGSVLIVLSILTRPVIDPIAPIVIALFSLLVHHSGRAVAARRILIYLAIYGVLMAPWWIHNYQKYGTFVRLDLGDGNALIAGSVCPAMDPGVQKHVHMQPECIDFGTFTDPIQRNNAMRAAVQHYFQRAPGEFGVLSLRKFVAFWRPWVYTDSAPMRIAALVSYGLALSGTIGLLVLRWRTYRGLLSPVLLVSAYLSIVHSIGYSYIRYRLPLEPFFIVISSFAVASLLARVFPRQKWVPSSLANGLSPS